MPSGQSVNGTQTTLDPTPAASLAPIAVYTMVEPGAGGALGAAGLGLFENLLQATEMAATPRADTAIRKIGEDRLTQEKVAPKATQGPGDHH